MNISIAKKITFLTLALFANTSFSSSNNLFNAGVPSLAPMLKDVTPAVVNIYTINETKEKNSYIDDPFLRNPGRPHIFFAGTLPLWIFLAVLKIAWGLGKDLGAWR